MNHARFWEFINGDAVKLTLKPGQRLEHCHHGPTDEGWTSTATSWQLDKSGRFLRREITSDGRDCDGRHSSECDSIATADPADYVPMYYTPELRRPNWLMAHSSQHDYTAEAAGY